MVAGKLLVLPIRPGVGTVRVLLVGSGIDDVSGGPSCARENPTCRARNAAERTTWQNRVTQPPRGFHLQQVRKMSLIQAGRRGQRNRKKRVKGILRLRRPIRFANQSAPLRMTKLLGLS